MQNKEPNGSSKAHTSVFKRASARVRDRVLSSTKAPKASAEICGRNRKDINIEKRLYYTPASTASTLNQILSPPTALHLLVTSINPHNNNHISLSKHNVQINNNAAKTSLHAAIIPASSRSAQPLQRQTSAARPSPYQLILNPSSSLDSIPPPERTDTKTWSAFKS